MNHDQSGAEGVHAGRPITAVEPAALMGYPLLPWFGIMAIGYAFGEVLIQPRRSRIKVTAITGLALILAFEFLRASNVYGGPAPWSVQPASYPPGYGYGLPLVYLTWIVAVAILFWPCYCLAELRRRRHRDRKWLSYL